MLCPFDAGPELSILIRAGFRIIGQRWTALRDPRYGATPAPIRLGGEEVELLRMPGWVDRPKHALRAVPPPPQRVMDLSLEHCGASTPRAACEAVLIVEAARRARASIRRISDGEEAMQLLRAAWPATEVQTERRSNPLAVRLGQRCAIYSIALSRDAHDIAHLLSAMIESPRPRVTVTLGAAMGSRVRAAG
jgi:hypothetical protein